VIKVQGKIPREVGVAVSGGADSMCILDFLRKNHNVTAYHFNHGTKNADLFERFVRASCLKMEIPIKVGDIKNSRAKGQSLEEYWREERYSWLREQGQTIVLGHHLDDCVESYLFNMCNGKDYTIPYRHYNCIRPFRLNRKLNIANWLKDHKDILWVEDPSNIDERFKRNYVRWNLVPTALEVNPGLYKVIAKRIKSETVE
jgi:tRNA(Ile)-lysidine synthase